MSRSIKIFDDEIIAKKVFTKIENASKLPLNYINKNKDKYVKDIKTGKLVSKNMFRKNIEVVVKITSGSKNSSWTITKTSAFTFPILAIIVAEPIPFAVIKPVFDTVATLVLLLLQLIVLLVTLVG